MITTVPYSLLLGTDSPKNTNYTLSNSCGTIVRRVVGHIWKDFFLSQQHSDDTASLTHDSACVVKFRGFDGTQSIAHARNAVGKHPSTGTYVLRTPTTGTKFCTQSSNSNQC